MKNTVIEFFQNLPENKTEQFNKAFDLYRLSPEKNFNTERILNASGYSDTNLQSLLYDLQKMHGITDIEKLPVEKEPEHSELYLSQLDYIKKIDIATTDEIENWGEFLARNSSNDQDTTNLVSDLESILEVATDLGNSKAILVLSGFIEIVNTKVIPLNSEPVVEIIKKLETYNAQDIATLKEKLFSCEDKVELMRNINLMVMLGMAINKPNAVKILQDLIVEISTPAVNSDPAKLPGADEGDDSLKNENEDLKNENEDLTNQNQDLQDENDELKGEIEKSKSVDKINAESIRNEFPFLSKEDCPNELKILVADKITAWNVYLENHEDLLKIQRGELIVSDDIKVKIAQSAVDSFDENQKIYDELNAYKETGKVLGKHKIFRTLQFQREVDKMTNAELISYRNSTAKFFSVNKKQLEVATKKKDLEKVEELNAKIEKRNEMLALVNKKLGV